MTEALRSSSLLLAVIAGMCLACGGGVSVDPETHLEPICRSSGLEMPFGGARARVDVASTKVRGGVAVYLGDELGFGHDSRVVTVQELRAEIQWINRISLAAQRPTVDVMLHIADHITLADVQEIAVALVDFGAGTIRMVVNTNEPWPSPVYPDPEFAEAFKGGLAALSPELRTVSAASEIESLITACPGAQGAFQAAPNDPANVRCILMAHLLKEALPSCPFTDGDAVVTAFQVMVEPTSETRPGLLTATLDPRGTPVPVPADATWAVIAPLLKKQSGGVWPVAEGS